MKAVFLDYATLGPDLNLDGLHALLPNLDIFDVSTTAQIAERIKGADIVLTNKARFGDELLRKNPSLRFIGLTATGTDNVDLDAAARFNIAVSNIRGYCTQSIVEHVFACLLNLTHSLSRYDASVRAGDWQRSDDFCLLAHPIRELSSMTLGIVGFGVLGRGVANAAKAFGMDVIVAARRGADVIDNDRVSFDKLLRHSDAISLHCPLTSATAGLFGKAEFQEMKCNAFLINTARGGLVDSTALAAALRHGEIAGAAVDVLKQEPPIDGDPLLDYDDANLLITPHIAWGSHEARQAAIDELVANVTAFIDGKERNRVA